MRRRNVRERDVVRRGEQLHAVCLALAMLRQAREELKAAGASTRCVNKVRRAISSVYGARRHAGRGGSIYG